MTVEVVCKGDLFRLVSGNENVVGIRCRFTGDLEDTELANVPGHSLAKSGTGMATVRCRCRCSSEVLDDHTAAWIVLPNGDIVACEASKADEKIYSKLSVVNRYLFVWILLVRVFVVLLGNYVKSLRKAFEVAKIASVVLIDALDVISQ